MNVRGPALLIALACAVLFIVLLAYACGAENVSGAPARPAAVSSPDGRRHCSEARRGFVWYRKVTARWYRQMGAGSKGRTAILPRTCLQWRYGAKRERLRARIARLSFEDWFIRTFHRWRCVHEREGPWNDDGSPYYGGLQMDWNYMAAYGREYLNRWGHAGRWPIWAQLVAGERGRLERGWHPWPNTARECGLL